MLSPRCVRTPVPEGTRKHLKMSLALTMAIGSVLLNDYPMDSYNKNRKELFREKMREILGFEYTYRLLAEYDSYDL